MKSIIKLTSILGIICLLHACTKQNLSELNIESANPYQLSFNLADYEYYVATDSLTFNKIKGTQIVHESTKVKHIDQYPGYLWFDNNTTEDSVVLFLSLAYQSNLNDTITYTFDFMFDESLENLIELEEGVYQYIDASDLYEQLLSFDKNARINFRSSEYHHLSFNDKKFFNQTDLFYFEDEILEISEITYNKNSNQIVINLNWNAYFKQLSLDFILHTK